MFFHTSIKGLLWAVAQNGTPFLVSADARYVIGGDVSVIANGKLGGLDTAFETAKNRHTLATLDPANLTIYPAKDERAVVYVATDINCPYCKILHKNIPNLTAKGITSRSSAILSMMSRLSPCDKSGASVITPSAPSS